MENYTRVGRPTTRRPHSWNKTMYRDGLMMNVSPSPGNTFTRDTYPPRGRGRGESLTSPRRIAAKQRALEVVKLRLGQHLTWATIARLLGFKDASGAYYAYHRLLDRINWDKQRARDIENEQWRELMGNPTADKQKDLFAWMREYEELAQEEEDNL
jgi:hypothetical protein